MTDLPPTVHKVLPPAPGAHHVPKWAWIAGGGTAVLALILVERHKSNTADAVAAATNDPATAGFGAGTVDSAVAGANGDPTVASGTTYPLPAGGGAPIVIGDPTQALPAEDLTSVDTAGTQQLPPIGTIQIGPINTAPAPTAPVTGGGQAKGRHTRTPKPAKKHHGAKNLAHHHAPAGHRHDSPVRANHPAGDAANHPTHSPGMAAHSVAVQHPAALHPQHPAAKPPKPKPPMKPSKKHR